MKIDNKTMYAMSLSVLVLGISCLSGCTPKHGSQGIFVSADVPLATYVKEGAKASHGKELLLSFPELRVYNGAGALVYYGHESYENAKLLGELPDRINQMTEIPDTVGIAAIIDGRPEFRARKPELIGNQKINIVSVFLEDCHACSVQQEALDSNKKAFLTRGLNLLVLHVSKH